MYLIKYELLIGNSKHYAPSAAGALRLVREIHAGGGRIVVITRTRDGMVLTLLELTKEAEGEIGPVDERPTSLLERVRRRLLPRDRGQS